MGLEGTTITVREADREAVMLAVVEKRLAGAAGDAVRAAALSLVRELHADFGPTFAAEKHGIALPRETLRKWMSEDWLWRPETAPGGADSPEPASTGAAGELVQVDASPHDWAGAAPLAGP